MSVEENVGSAVLHYISYAKFSQILEVLLDFLRLFGSRNSRSTGVWPASLSLALVPHSKVSGHAHDSETRL